MKNRLLPMVRHMRRSYRLFMAEYLSYFGLRNVRRPAREPELALPF